MTHRKTPDDYETFDLYWKNEVLIPLRNSYKELTGEDISKELKLNE